MPPSFMFSFRIRLAHVAGEGRCKGEEVTVGYGSLVKSIHHLRSLNALVNNLLAPTISALH